MRSPAICILLITLLAPAGLTGCRQQGTFDRVHFETLYYGQPDYAVEETLGPPTRREPARWIYISPRPYYWAEILFEAGRVSEKTWLWQRPAEGSAGSEPSKP